MAREKKIPQRRCVGCGQMKSKQELLRVIRRPDGIVSADPTGRANGRGAYLCRNSTCLDKAVRAKSLQRSLGAAIDPQILMNLRTEIEKSDTDK